MRKSGKSEKTCALAAFRPARQTRDTMKGVWGSICGVKEGFASEIAAIRMRQFATFRRRDIAARVLMVAIVIVTISASGSVAWDAIYPKERHFLAMEDPVRCDEARKLPHLKGHIFTEGALCMIEGEVKLDDFEYKVEVKGGSFTVPAWEARHTKTMAMRRD